jgi:hypothetical protein
MKDRDKDEPPRHKGTKTSVAAELKELINFNVALIKDGIRRIVL